MVDIFGAMKKVQALQSKMQETQDELGRMVVAGQSGGGMVVVNMTAKGDVKTISIDSSLLTPADKEMVEDLIVAALNDAKAKADQAAQEKMQALTAGLPLPPGMKLPF